MDLAEDMYKASIEGLDLDVLREVSKSKDKDARSLKLLQLLVESTAGKDEAYDLMGSLFGVYDLRIASTHSGKKNIDGALAKVKVRTDSHFIDQGVCLLESVAISLNKIAKIINGTLPT